MADLTLDCSACGKKFRVSFAVKPKQVTCPQCKAKVNTSADPAPAGASPAVLASASPAVEGAAPAKSEVTTPVDSRASGAKPQPKRRLPVLLNPEDVEFKGWTYDQEAEKLRGGLQKADVLGIVWIGGVVLMVGVILFRLKMKLVGEGLMGLGGAGLALAGCLFLQLKKKPDETACLKCRGALGLVHTIPTAREAQAKNYTRGASGYAYRVEHGPTPKVWEIHKTWHVCKVCKRYFLAEKEMRDFVGAAQTDMEKREALYAEAAAALAAPAPASEAPAPASKPV